MMPLWTRSGKELFYVSGDGALLRVPVEASRATWNAGTPMKLLERGYYAPKRLRWPHLRRVARRPVLPDDQSIRERCATRADRRATLGRGAEAPRADEVASRAAAARTPFERCETPRRGLLLPGSAGASDLTVVVRRQSGVYRGRRETRFLTPEGPARSDSRSRYRRRTSIRPSSPCATL